MRLSEFIHTLIPPPARLLEVGCGDGALARELTAIGYDVLAIDPRAPAGPLFRKVTLDELDEPGQFDVAVAERVLHHVSPLGPAFEKLARLAQLLVLEEFASEGIDPETQAWYETLHRELEADGRDPKGPPDLDRWRADHPGLHSSGTLLHAAAIPFEKQHLEWQPYFYRWLAAPDVQEQERTAIARGLIRPIGFRYVGLRR